MAARCKYRLSGIYSGTRIDFVDRTAAELRAEARRMQSVIERSRLRLNRLSRHRHPILHFSRVQLEAAAAVCELAEDAAPDVMANHVVTMTFLLMDTEKVLNRLRNCKSPAIEEVRSALHYGGVHVKKEGDYASKIVSKRRNGLSRGL